MKRIGGIAAIVGLVALVGAAVWWLVVHALGTRAATQAVQAHTGATQAQAAAALARSHALTYETWLKARQAYRAQLPNVDLVTVVAMRDWDRKHPAPPIA